MMRKGGPAQRASKDNEPSPPQQRTGVAQHAQINRLLSEESAGIEEQEAVLCGLTPAAVASSAKELEHLPLVQNLDEFLAAEMAFERPTHQYQHLM